MTASPQTYARVAIPVPLGQAFSYEVPGELEPQVRRGARVLCEFGRRRVLGVVLDVAREAPDVAPGRIKPIRAVVDAEPVLPEELLGFLQELSRYYLTPIGAAMELGLPLVERRAARALAEQDDFEVTRAVGRLVSTARAVPGALAPPELKGRARALFEELVAGGSAVPVSELAKRFTSARSALKRLAELGLVELAKEQSRFDPFFAPVQPDTPPELTPAQAQAVQAIVSRLTHAERHAFLLEGVTASGKTEVYLRAAEQAMQLGRGVIVLVPEIALTPQLVTRFRARLGQRIAVLHSALGDAERHAMWRALRRGELTVAIGARSALFAPVRDLGLICVDEEHDASFKQEEGVRYNARDMALLRAHRAGAVAVLGSATPSLASVALCREGKLERLVLPSRARSDAVLPEVEIVDLRRAGPGPGGERLLSLPLYRALEGVLDKGQQAILFLNRRGFAPSLFCESCGAPAECPHCSVALTVHRAAGARLVCHYCDFSEPVRTRCATCGGGPLAEDGSGTERIEATLAQIFPRARVARLDRDVAAGAKSERVLERMRSGQIDILVGTQMVTKGHDLPRVTLVGVLNADAALSMPDFRAAERSFHLLVQVSGRAGRGSEPGRVLIQTRQPDHPAIFHALSHDVGGFVERELEARAELGYPPFSRLALVRFDALDEERAGREALRVAGLVRKSGTNGVELLGPAPAPLRRLRNRYRYRFLLRARERGPLRQALLIVARAAVDRNVRMSIDVDPMNML